ncbi:putative membrane protein YqjE [Hydrogenophaga palleronii]|uniref:Membrane protein YqjE n=1 Tax=Hydrogenophaga palleronii TaxID=65655 RepID=A0ABU1WPD5_9BURK|nr:phage holin family protein [Hydrogenophaga palleronii]MDR7151128.1 putative membrane protein YqjE [Hydrogenophaga palleronii]
MSESPQRLSASLKTLAGTVLELLQLRLELLSVEAQEEVQRLGGLLVYGAVAVTFVSLGLGFLSILITVALWESHRLLALSVFATLFLTLGGVFAWMARERALAGTRFFSSSAEELKRDRESLRS